MNLERKAVWLLSLILFFADVGQALPGQSSHNFYVSPGGNDLNPGTADEPVLSLVRARDIAREYRKTAGKDQILEIIALGGEYLMLQPLELTPDDNGTENAPLIIRGEEGKKTIFRGGVQIAGWEKTGDKLWRAFMPQVAYNNSYFEQLYVNGRRAVRARTPDDGFYFVKRVDETVIEKGEGRSPEVAVQKVLFDSTDAGSFQSFTNRDFEDALIVFYHNWDNTRKHILSFDRKQSAIYIVGEGMKPWNPINSKSRWFVENFIGALDSPGEWYLDRSGYIYYIPLPGETPENTVIYAPIIKEFIRITGESSEKQVSGISFNNLSFEMAGYLTPPYGNEPAQAAAPVPAVITLDFARGIDFTNCEISHTGTYAFWFRRAVHDCRLKHCYLHDLGAGGVKIGETIIRPVPFEITSHITVDNNIIRDAGHIFPCAVGIIIFNASDNQLTHNDISDLRYSGISAGWVWGYASSPSKRNKIEFNHIHHLGWGELCDMGGVYTLGASEGTTISNNVIHHIYSFDYGGWGLYTDEGTYGIVEENNLVYACKSSGFHQHYGKENIIRNNIFALNIRAQLQATRIEEHRSISFTNNIIYFDRGTLLSSNWNKFNLLSDYNCYWDTRTKDVRFADKSFKEWKESGKDIHSVIDNPLFVNPPEFDFHFQNLSVARRIRFTPFNYSAAGVYGSDEWKNLAIPDNEIVNRFDVRIIKMEARK